MAGMRNVMEQDWLRVCTVQQSCCPRVVLPRVYATEWGENDSCAGPNQLTGLSGTVVDTTPYQIIVLQLALIIIQAFERPLLFKRHPLWAMLVI